jgi:uncharacterized RDD family membrane protein YckC
VHPAATIAPSFGDPPAGSAPAPEPGVSGQTRIVTGEAIHLDLRLAGIGSRALARLIDLLVQFLVYQLLRLLLIWLVEFLIGHGLVQFDGALATALNIVLIVAVLVGYPVLFETLTRGRTVGKMALGLRVVRDDGGPVTARQSLTRALVALSIEWPGILAAPVTWLVTIWVMIASPTSKRIGDHVAGTIVIHERTPAGSAWAPVMPYGLETWAATLDLTGLDDDLALAVRSFLARARRLREPACSMLGERLVREVAAVTNPPPPAGVPPWAYLAAVHAERHRRAAQRLAAVRARAATVWPELAAAVAPPASHPTDGKPHRP